MSDYYNKYSALLECLLYREGIRAHESLTVFSPISPQTWGDVWVEEPCSRLQAGGFLPPHVLTFFCLTAHEAALLSWALGKSGWK